MSRINLLLIIPHLGGGGAERVTALLAIHLSPAIFNIHLVLISPDHCGSESIPSSTTIHRLHARRVRHSAFPLIRLIRQIGPDIILSNMAHFNFLILILKLFLPSKSSIIVRQNTTASASNTWLTRHLYRWLYPLADRVICQSGAMADDLAANFSIPDEKLVILANPIAVEQIRSQTTQLQPSTSPPQLLAIGRLSYEKGFDILLNAIAILKFRHRSLCLTLVGSGPERESLGRLAQDLDLSGQVQFAGHQSNLIPCYQGATLFVLSSRHEGMPNALLEAAAAGLPIVSTRCCQGVVDLLQDAPGAWLTASIAAQSLAETIVAALHTIQTRPRYDHQFLAPFETATAIAAYETLLLQQATKSKA